MALRRLLIWCPRAIEQILQLIERRCAHRASLPSRYDKSHRPVERRQLGIDERARHLLGQAQARDAAHAVLDAVLDRHLTIADRDRVGERHPPRTHGWRYEAIDIDR